MSTHCKSCLGRDTVPQCCTCKHWRHGEADGFANAQCRRKGKLVNAYDAACGWYRKIPTDRDNHPLTVNDIMLDYLKAHGYDGLCRTDGDGCGCTIEDLCPCDGIQKDCEPAYNHPAIARREGCDCYMTKQPPKRRGK